MRFDDRLSTVLNGDFASPRARVVCWQQLTDVLAQAGPNMALQVAERTLHIVALLGGDVPSDTFAAHARGIACRSRYAPLLVLLAAQSHAAAEAVIPLAQLHDDEWVAAIPGLGPLARSLLRQREDLGPQARQALALLASGDMALSYQQPSTSNPAPHSPEIRDLVRRIEEYRQRQQLDMERNKVSAGTAAADRVAFVTDALGRIIDADVRGRGRFIGIELGQPAAAFETGCDAGTARIISKRGQVTNGRLLVLGDDRWSGTWLCNAEPRFTADDGVFRGYTGVLRRPRPTDIVVPQPAHATPAADASVYAPDLLRQLMHELRSPLNAIAGFAQLIDGQYSGPVAASYRASAQTILAEAEKLAGVIDEIDMLARMSSDEADAEKVAMGSNFAEALTSLAGELATSGHLRHFNMPEGASLKAHVLAVSPGTLSSILRLWLLPLVRARTSTAPMTLHLHTDAANTNLQLMLSGEGLAQAAPDIAHSASPSFAFLAAAEQARKAGGWLQGGDGQHILNLPLLDEHYISGERVG